MVTFGYIVSPTYEDYFWQGYMLRMPAWALTVNYTTRFAILFDAGRNDGSEIDVTVFTRALVQVKNTVGQAGYVDVWFRGISDSGSETDIAILGAMLHWGHVVFYDRGPGRRIGFAEGPDCYGTLRLNL